MVQRVATVAFEGIEARAVDLQVQVAPGLPAFKLGDTVHTSVNQNPTSEGVDNRGGVLRSVRDKEEASTPSRQAVR